MGARRHWWAEFVARVGSNPGPLGPAPWPAGALARWRKPGRASQDGRRAGIGRDLPVLIWIVLLALVLRLARLGFQPLWWDEGWSLYFATSDPGAMLQLTAVDIHPPLYYLLLHLWTKLFGPSPISVRLLSVLIGAAAVPLIYLVGRRLFGQQIPTDPDRSRPIGPAGREGANVGLLAALLLAISPFHIYYSQEVRMYGLVTLLGLATLYFASVRGTISVRGNRWAWVGYVVAATAALYTQYYAAFLILALNLVVLLLWFRARRSVKAPTYPGPMPVLARPSWLAPAGQDASGPSRPDGPGPGGRDRGGERELFSWLAAQAAVVVLYLPWLWYASDKLLTYVRYKVVADKDLPLDPMTYLARHLAAFVGGHAEGALAGWWWLGLVPLLVLALALLVLLRHRSRTRQTSPGAGWQGAGWAVCLAVVAVSLACGYLVNLVFPFNPPRSERLLLLALPAFLLLFSAALLTLWRHPGPLVPPPWSRPVGPGWPAGVLARWRKPGRASQDGRRAGIGRALRRLLAVLPAVALFAVAILSLGFFYTVPRYPDDDYRPVAARLQALALPTDAVVSVHPWQVGYFESYLPTPRPRLMLTPREVIPRERQLWADDPALMAADLQQLLADQGRLWLPAHQAMGRVLEGQIEAYLVEHAYPTLSEWYGEHTLLSLFTAGETQPVSVTAHFDDWLALDGAALSDAPLPAGSGVLATELTWRLLSPPPAGAGDLTVGLRLVDAAGRVWAQRDSLPLAGSAPFSEWAVGEPGVDRHGLLVPAGTPPGEYQVTLRVYRQPDSVLPATFAGGSGGEVILGTAQVVRPATPPSVEALAVDRPLQADFDRLRLLGFDLLGSSADYQTGEVVDVDLFWQALAAPGEDYLPRLQLLDAAGTVYAELTEKPVAGAYPTAWWQAGELVRDPHALPIPAATPAGRYRLALSLVRAVDGSLVPAQRAGMVEAGRGQTSIDLAEVEVQAREHRYEPPAPVHVQAAQFGPAVELAGYDLAESASAPGSPLEVTLYWHARQTPDKNYRVFVHLLDAEGQIVAQHDGAPGEGELPALGWLPGEYVTDTHRLALPSNLPAGEYSLEVGLYDPVTRQRLGEPVLLDTPVIVSSGSQ
jgi:hypothetical protein